MEPASERVLCHILQNVTFNTNNYFTFTPTIGDDHKLNAVLGMSYQQNDYQHGAATG